MSSIDLIHVSTTITTPTATATQVSAHVHLVGSRLYGAGLPGADVDVVVELSPGAQARESIEVRESTRVFLGDFQQQIVFLVEHRGSFRGYPLNYPP